MFTNNKIIPLTKNKQNFQPILDAALNQLDLTINAAGSIDAKAAAVLALNVALAIFGLQGNFEWPLYLSVAAFGVSSLIALYIILPQDYRGSLTDIKKHPGYLKLGEQQLILQLLADALAAINANTASNAKKSRLCWLSILLSFAGALLLIACIIKA